MTKKQAGRSKGLLFAGGMLVGLVFLFFVPRDAAGRLQLTYAQVFRWPLAMTGVVRVQTTSQVRNVTPKEYEELLKAYQQTRNNSANVEAQLQEAQSQIERLTKLRSKPGLEHMQPIPARVIQQVQDELTIGQGQESGVAVGQYVMSLTNARLNDQCVVGVVSAVSAKGAKVKLITDPTSRLPISITGLNASKFMLEGRGDGTVRIPLVPQSYAVHIGDVVYAEKKQGFLDVPVIVAQVTQCKRDANNPLVWEITAQPVCDLTALGDVAVMKPPSVP